MGDIGVWGVAVGRGVEVALAAAVVQRQPLLPGLVADAGDTHNGVLVDLGSAKT